MGWRGRGPSRGRECESSGRAGGGETRVALNVMHVPHNGTAARKNYSKIIISFTLFLEPRRAGLLYTYIYIIFQCARQNWDFFIPIMVPNVCFFSKNIK